MLLLAVLALGKAPAQYQETPAGIDKNYKMIGGRFVDMRRASPEDLKELAIQERLKDIQKDRFLFSIGGTLYNPKNSLAVRFQQGTDSKIYEGVDDTWGNLPVKRLIVYGTASIEFANVVVDKSKAADYKYHVVQNNIRELVSWRSPDTFKSTQSGAAVYAHLGKFDYKPGQFILIEMYNTKNYKDRDAIIIDWREIKPAEPQVGVEHTATWYPNGLNYHSIDSLKNRTWENFIETTDINDKKFRLGDSLVRLYIRLESLGFYNYRVQLKRTVNDKTETIQLKDENSRFYLYKEYWKEPGNYELIFTPKLPSPGGNPVTYLKDKAVSYKFTVLPATEKGYFISFAEMGIIAFAFIVPAGIILAIFISKNRRKLKLERQYKEFARAQLATVRSQLNPHFLFNALAGIQNLINKNDIDKANRYLGKFARLTRNVLDERPNDQISIEDEKALLDDYLQMEQLRFPFQYAISTEPQLATAEIPAMLLQPFVENAVKHGVSQLETNGQINIKFEQRSKDLLISIHDNGTGFKVEENYPGLGINLSKSRISLLNKIYVDTPIELQMKAGTQGSFIIIILKDWIA